MKKLLAYFSILSAFIVIFVLGTYIGVHQLYPMQLLVNAKHFLEEGFYPNRLLQGKTVAQVQKNTPYFLNTYQRSVLLIDKDRRYVRTKNGQFIWKPNSYWFQTEFFPDDTAVIVMDSWIVENKVVGHSGTKSLEIIEKKIIPLVEKSKKLGFQVIVLTNSPEGMNSTAATDIRPYFKLMAQKGEISVNFHSQLNSTEFSQQLQKSGIKNLIYVGFSSNSCILFRDLGLATMSGKGFNLFFVPEASSGSGDETDKRKPSGYTHEAATFIISLCLAKIIAFEDFMGL